MLAAAGFHPALFERLQRALGDDFATEPRRQYQKCAVAEQRNRQRSGVALAEIFEDRFYDAQCDGGIADPNELAASRPRSGEAECKGRAQVTTVRAAANGGAVGWPAAMIQRAGVADASDEPVNASRMLPGTPEISPVATRNRAPWMAIKIVSH
jgi:hypothetical protein